MMRIDGRTWPPGRIARRRNLLWDRLQAWLVRDIVVVDGAEEYRFRCQNLREFRRCGDMFTKEPGTCDWLRQTVGAGEVFYDIGANIGVYTALAARRVGESGRVYAFEPHCGTFARLLETVAANKFEAIVRACSFALHDREGFYDFNYRSTIPGTSNSQLDSLATAKETLLVPDVTELKFATSVDALVQTHGFAPPDHVKIDVDGNELLILQGMRGLLGSSDRPKSLQLEMNKRYRAEIEPFMQSHGYELATTHYSRTSQKQIHKGRDPDEFSYNAIFRVRP
jgi:FkbM family methyltransferase